MTTLVPAAQAEIEHPTIIILEGIDGVGKSTLARRLQGQDGRRVVHSGPPKTYDWTAEYVTPVKICFETNANVVFDRFHLGEWVWPDIFNRKSIFKTFDDVIACHLEILSMGANIIYVKRNMKAVENTLRERGEDAMIPMLRKADAMFEQLADELPMISTCDSDDLHKDIWPWLG